MRILLPHQLDPRTGQPVTLEIFGEPYTETHRWQQLSVTSTDELVEKQMMLVRRRLASVLEGRDLDTRDRHVDQISIHVPLSKGVTEVHVDELLLGPIVRLSDEQDTIRQIQFDQSKCRSVRSGSPPTSCWLRNSLCFHASPFTMVRTLMH